MPVPPSNVQQQVRASNPLVEKAQTITFCLRNSTPAPAMQDTSSASSPVSPTHQDGAAPPWVRPTEAGIVSGLAGFGQ